MSLDFRDIDTRIKAGAFLLELNALLGKYEAVLGCAGYECEGLELEFRRGATQTLSLPEKIGTQHTVHSVTLEESY